MFSELRPRIVIDGLLEEIMGTCIDQAKNTFRERWGKDTNPKIVQMIHHGKPIDHWYYRSDQWISQPYVWPAMFMQSFVGSTDSIGAVRYREGTYLYEKDDQLITELLIEELSSK